VPRCRSPATAAVANPTANTLFRISEIGWIAPRAIEPDSEKMSPPPNCVSCSGIRPDWMMSRNV
jgi:hypothetical protein